MKPTTSCFYASLVRTNVRLLCWCLLISVSFLYYIKFLSSMSGENREVISYSDAYLKYMLLMTFTRELQSTFASRANLWVSSPCQKPEPLSDLLPWQSRGHAAFPKRLLKAGHCGLDEGPWLLLLCLLCSCNPTAAVWISFDSSCCSKAAGALETWPWPLLSW